MKNIRLLFALAVVILFGVGMTTSCKNKVADNLQAEATTDTLSIEQGEDEFLSAIETYLITIGNQYALGEICIPSYTVVAINESDTDYIRVWGDWWVFNYNIVGDTLRCVSGGSHPGLMYLKQNDSNEWVVASFDQVEDGSRNLTSAKRIFGEYYDAFHKVNSSQEHRDTVRLIQVANYVQEHNIPVTRLQDSSWPAVQLPI